MAAEGDDIALLTSPAADWMPVFAPILYVFQRTGPGLAFYPTLIVKIEVSHNGEDFSDPITAGIISVPIGTMDRYTVNPAPYLADMFSVGPPVLGADTQLYKLYRLIVGRSDVYDGTTGTPEITTTPARCIYAVHLPEIEVDADTNLSFPPTDAYHADYPGILTVIDYSTNFVTNRITDPPSAPILPCPKYPKNIYWLNRQGGWQSYVFDGKHEYEDEVAEGVTWQDANGNTHTASLGPVQHKCAVKSGFVSKSIYDTIAGIRNSIKVYHNDNGTWREVNIERGSYPKYKEGDKRREVNFSFTYAEPLTIQTA